MFFLLFRLCRLIDIFIIVGMFNVCDKIVVWELVVFLREMIVSSLFLGSVVNMFVVSFCIIKITGLLILG